MRKRMLVLLLAAAICMGGCGQRPGGTEPAVNMEEDEEQKDSGAEQNRKEDGSDAASEGTDNTEGEDGNIVSGEPASGAEEEKGIVQAKGLAELYQENFPIGIALSGYILQNTEQYGQVILENFNSITCENVNDHESKLDKDL